MTCARYRALISRYLDGELTPRQKAELLRHVETCSACAQALAKYRQGEVLLKRLPESRTPDYIKASVLSEARRVRSSRRGLRRALGGGSRVSARFAAFLALCLLLVITGWVVIPRSAELIAHDSIVFTGPASPTAAFTLAPLILPTQTIAPLAQPRLINTDPTPSATAVSTDSIVLLRFDQAMDRHSVEKAFRIDPPTLGSFTWEADNEVRFTPDPAGLLRGVDYTVTLSQGARSLTGAPLFAAVNLKFSTLAQPALASAFPAADAVAVPMTSTVVLTFTQPMDTQSVSVTAHDAAYAANSKLAAPAWSLSGSLSWSQDNTVAVFTPSAPLPAGQAALEIGAGGRDALGGTLPSYSWSFNVAAPPRMIEFSGPGLQTLTSLPAAELTLDYSASAAGDSSADLLHFDAYRLTLANLTNLLPSLVAAHESAAPVAQPAIDLSTLAPVRSWDADSARAGSASPLWTGQTILPFHESGAYLVAGSIVGGQGANKVVVLADTGLIALGDSGHWTVWLQRFDSAGSVAGSRVTLFDKVGAVLAQGLVGGDGFFRVDLPSGVLPAVAVAEREDVVGLSFIDPESVSDNANQAANALMLTDQPVYHPGDIVSFKGLLPAAGANQGQIVQVSLLDPHNSLIGQQRLKADKLGALSGSFALASGLPAGNYSIELASVGSFFRQQFAVQADVARPQLLVSTTFSNSAIAPGDLVTATVQALVAPAAPAASLPVTLTLSDANAVVRDVFTGTTSAAGLASFQIETAANDATQLYLHAQVAGALGGEDFARLPFAHSDLVLTQQLNQHSFSPGDTLTVTATLTTSDTRPVSGRVVAITLAIKGVGAAPDTQMSQRHEISDGSGVVSASFPLPLQGSFVISAALADGSDTMVASSDRFWVYGDPAMSWSVPSGIANVLQLTPDKLSYKPGDTARLLAQTGAAGSALLLSSYNGRVVGQQVVDLAGNGSLITVPIPAAPPAASALRLTILRFDASAEQPAISSTNIDLALDQAREDAPVVQVTLNKPAGEYSPGDQVQARITLSSSAGITLTGQVVVRLSPENDNVPASSASEIAAGATSYWNANLLINSSGVVTTTFSLPAASQSWRLDVWGITAAGVGMSHVTLDAVAPVTARWNPVSNLVVGDSNTVQASITNNQAETVSLQARLLADGVLSLVSSNPAQQSVSLRPGQTIDLRWQLSAPRSGDGRLSLDVGWDAGPGWAAGAIRQTSAVAVAEYGLLNTQSASGALSGGATVEMTLPASADVDQAQLEVSCDASLSSLLLNAFTSQLANVNQGPALVSAAASRVTSYIIVREMIARNLIDSDLLPAAANAQQSRDLQYLYAAQQADGGWAEAPGGASSVSTTASVLRSLWRLQQAPPDPAIELPQIEQANLDRALAWLQQAIKPAALAPGANANVDQAALSDKAQALYALALYKSANAADALSLLGSSAALDASGRSWLALTLYQLGLGPQATLLLDRLALTDLASSATAGQNVAAAAAALQALLTIAPATASAAASDAVDYLLSHRDGAGWNSGVSGDVAAALALYAESHPAALEPFSYRVLVNDKLVREVAVAQGAGGSLSVIVPGSLLHIGQNSVRIEAGDGQVYYSLFASAILFNSVHPIPADSASEFNGAVSRDYQKAGASGALAIGDIVDVTHIITVTNGVGALQLSDPLPGALTRLGGFTLSSITAGSSSAAPSAETQLTTNIPLLSAGDTGNAIILPPLAPGSYRLSYQAVVTNSGNFVALPATIQSVGGGETLARSATDTLNIVK